MSTEYEESNPSSQSKCKTLLLIGDSKMYRVKTSFSTPLFHLFAELYQEVLRSVYTEYDGKGFIEQHGGLPGLVHAPT